MERRRRARSKTGAHDEFSFYFERGVGVRRRRLEKLLEQVDGIRGLAVAALEDVAEQLPGRPAELLPGLAREHAATEVEDDALVDRDLRRGDGPRGAERKRELALGVRDVSAGVAEALHDRRTEHDAALVGDRPVEPDRAVGGDGDVAARERQVRGRDAAVGQPQRGLERRELRRLEARRHLEAGDLADGRKRARDLGHELDGAQVGVRDRDPPVPASGLRNRLPAESPARDRELAVETPREDVAERGRRLEEGFAPTPRTSKDKWESEFGCAKSDSMRAENVPPKTAADGTSVSAPSFHVQSAASFSNATLRSVSRRDRDPARHRRLRRARRAWPGPRRAPKQRLPVGGDGEGRRVDGASHLEIGCGRLGPAPRPGARPASFTPDGSVPAIPGSPVTLSIATSPGVAIRRSTRGSLRRSVDPPLDPRAAGSPTESECVR